MTCWSTYLDVGVAVDESYGFLKAPETTAKALHQEIPHGPWAVLYSKQFRIYKLQWFLELNKEAVFLYSMIVTIARSSL